VSLLEKLDKLAFIKGWNLENKPTAKERYRRGTTFMWASTLWFLGALVFILSSGAMRIAAICYVIVGVIWLVTGYFTRRKARQEMMK